MGEPAHQLLYKRSNEKWKRWVGVPNLKKETNKLTYACVHYKNDNKKKNSHCQQCN